MKLTKSICCLIADLEHIIGSQCYNPNSYDGWNLTEGCEFRYPITVRRKDKNDELQTFKIRGSLDYDDSPFLTEDSISHMYYAFGSNHLHIGAGLKTVLEKLELRYDLDFNELEKNRKDEL